MGKLEHTNSGEKNEFYYLACAIICSPSVEQERENATGTKGVRVFATRHMGKAGDIVRARIGRVTWDSQVWLSLLSRCVE